MDITESTSGATMIAEMRGRLDTATAPAVEVKLLGMLAAGGKLIADLRAVDYVSSAGLRVLLKVAKHAKAVGADFALAAPQDAVREVLVMSGFDRVLSIHPTRGAAIVALA